ncbi:MAG: hypothetical protein NTX11_00920 [Candidatus Saccharibacteria bacterium]|nr:hypothetical protein [Candidatus Saccharibacteria bacterium]
MVDANNYLKKVTLFISIILVSFIGYNIAFNHRVSALSGSDFNAGRIIDDTVMFDGNAMNATEVQQFLNAKVPTCDDNGTQASSHWNDGAGRFYTRAEWGSISGYPAPYTCLKNFSENTVSKAADAYCSGNYTGGVKTAAQIINDVARACNVSQKSLIVLLQKEQGLITDDWPWSIQYRAATGYGCPDTAACDSTYYGFFNQVYNAARQFQRYVKQPDLFNYKSGVTRYIQYNPDAGCGGTNIYLENGATAALYNYTPYQPNASALNNLYGSGDGCGAYGNRNFWRMFNDWFGSTNSPTFGWQLINQYAYADETKAVGKGTNNLLPGEKVYVGFQARNTGSTVWNRSGNDTVKVGTTNPNDRVSPFCDPSWGYGCGRPAALKETSVAPGQIGTFEFWMKAPANAGNYSERFNLVIDGKAWFPDGGLTFSSSVITAQYNWTFAGQYAYSDETKTAGKGTTNLLPGEKVYVGFQARNTGNVTWSNTGPNPVNWSNTGPNPVNVGMVRPLDRASPAYDSTWLGTNRPAKLKEASVAPGQIGTFEFWVKAPANPGNYLEYFTLVSEGKSWFNDPGMNFSMSVR